MGEDAYDWTTDDREFRCPHGVVFCRRIHGGYMGTSMVRACPRCYLAALSEGEI